MITYIIIISSFILTNIISFFIGKILLRFKFKKLLSEGTGKYGIIIRKSYSYIEHVVEVEEVESAGDLTKVKLIRVCSCSDSKLSKLAVLKLLSFNQWIETNKIVWFNDNAQKDRDRKIENILKNNKV